MSRITKKNLKQYVISHLMGNPEECKALNTAGCPIRSGMTVESGRSMVEMLGVLAVIGVLSVAGIAGYSMAMRNYRANEIVNAASMFYVLAKAQNQGNGPSGNTDYETLGGKNPSGATLTYTDNAFTITFDNTDDCTMAANKLGDKAIADCANKTITVNFGERIATTICTSIDCCSPDNMSTSAVCCMYATDCGGSCEDVGGGIFKCVEYPGDPGWIIWNR